MADFLSKQHASYPVRYQKVSYNSATGFSTTFGVGVNHIRVASQLSGWATINQSTSDSIIASSAGGVGIFIAANQAGEYFTVRPGQFLTFASSSTSTGDVSVTEMS
jgi:hypothetical protein